MSVFAWKGQPSILAQADKTIRNPIVRKAPGPASQIAVSKNVPHSINTQSESDANRAQRLRRTEI